MGIRIFMKIKHIIILNTKENHSYEFNSETFFHKIIKIKNNNNTF